MYNVTPKKPASMTLVIPAPKHRMPCAGKGRKTHFSSKKRINRTSAKMGFKREEW